MTPNPSSATAAISAGVFSGTRHRSDFTPFVAPAGRVLRAPWGRPEPRRLPPWPFTRHPGNQVSRLDRPSFGRFLVREIKLPSTLHLDALSTAASAERGGAARLAPCA